MLKLGILAALLVCTVACAQILRVVVPTPTPIPTATPTAPIPVMTDEEKVARVHSYLTDICISGKQLNEAIAYSISYKGMEVFVPGYGRFWVDPVTKKVGAFNDVPAGACFLLPTSTPKPVTVGPTALCRDGTYSYSANRRGTCSHHGGVRIWYP